MIMGKFDLEQKYDKNQIYILEDLYNEILAESDTYLKSKNESDVKEFNYLKEYRYLEYKFKNKDNSGIIDKLKKLFLFDIEVEKNDIKTFETLKLLKYLYYLDKHDRIKCMIKLQDKNFVFLDMLAKPRLENFDTTLPVKSLYGETFEKVRSDINKVVPKSDELYNRFFKINYNWQFLLSKLSTYILEGLSFELPKISLKELIRIKRAFDEKICSKINNISPQKNSGENVFEDFLSILNSQSFLCSTHDNIIINNTCVLPDTPSHEYVTQYMNFDKIATTWEVLDLSKEFLKTAQGDDGVKYLLKMCLNSDNVTDCFLRNYKYALNHSKIVAKWFGNYLNMDMEAEINFTFLVAIIQEIMFLKENKNENKIINDYFGYNNKYRTLTSALKDPEYTNPIVLLTWQKRIENRIMTNMGQVDLIRKKREIENLVYKIKEFIFSFRNIDDMEVVSGFFFEIASEIIFSDFIAVQFGDEFFHKISNQLINNRFSVDISPDARNMYKFLKMMLIDEEKKTEKHVDFFVKRINDLYTTTCANNEITESYNFKIISNKTERNFTVHYKINLIDENLHFFDFKEIYDEKKIKRLRELGLSGFFD